MEYTDKIYEAINLVCNLHIHQTRKGNNTPYVSHCFSVAWILSNYTNNEDVIVAGLLHDVLEDVPEYTKEQITDQFGINVANLVSNVSEPKTDDNGKSLPWELRKQIYFKQLETGSNDALLISIADKIHNIKSIINSYHTNGNGIWQYFKSTKEQQLNRYQQILDYAKTKLNSSIVEDFEKIFNEFSKIAQYD